MREKIKLTEAERGKLKKLAFMCTLVGFNLIPTDIPTVDKKQK